ncbi:MAG: peptidylprolyl isomerase [Pseudomonadota bacterium]
MRNTLIALSLGLLCSLAFAEDKAPPHAYLEFETSMGNFVVELNGKESPKTVVHFLKLADSGYFDGTIFHRVRPGHVVQGGGHTPDLKPTDPVDKVVNESGNGMANFRGTIAMARGNDPHSADSQFYINLVDNVHLEPDKKLFGGRWGYTVFGQVIEGMETIDKIATVETTSVNTMDDVPVEPVILRSVTRYTFE